MSKTAESLIDALEQSHGSKPESKIVEKILEHPTIFKNSMWVHAPALMEQLQTITSPIYLTQAHYYSQSILLALFLANTGHKSTIFASKKQVEKGWASFAIPLREMDKVSSLKSLLNSEHINFIEYERMHAKKAK